MHLNVRTCVTIGVVALLIGDGVGDGVKHGAGVQDGVFRPPHQQFHRLTPIGRLQTHHSDATACHQC